MNYELIKQAIQLIEGFEKENSKYHMYDKDINGLKVWVKDSLQNENEPNWEGKEKGRSAESVISTLVVHMNRYAKSYSKSAILESDFSSQEDFIYLINLKAFGAMSKMDLIRKNVHEKPVGMQIINRLIAKNWVEQRDSDSDKRSKGIFVTDLGLQALDLQMPNIRTATEIVTGNLNHGEKMTLIKLLSKLNDFHQTIYDQNISSSDLLNRAKEKQVLDL